MNILKSNVAWAIYLWFIYTLFYGLTKNIPAIESLNGYLALIGEAGLDFLCAVLAFSVLAKCDTDSKTITKLFALSFVFGFISDGSYNIILNIMGIDTFPSLVETVFDLPFAAFLLLQTFAWFLIFKKVYHKSKYHLKGLILLPFLISGITVLLTFFLMPAWKVNFSSTEGIYNIIDTLLEVISFALVIICLFSARDKKITLLASGYLIVIASDFVIRFAEVEKVLFPGSPIETTWVLGLLLFAIGLANIKKQSYFNLNEGLGEWNSLKVQIGYWLFTSSLASLFILLLINSILSNLDIRNMHDIPATLIVFAVLSALLSQILAGYMVRPFRYLNEVISKYSRRDFKAFKNITSDIKIEEFKDLETCLHDGLKAIKQQSYLEREYFQVALAYSNRIMDPIAAIKMLAEDIDELPQEKKKLLFGAVQQVAENTDQLLQQLSATKGGETTKSQREIIEAIMVDDDKNLAMAWEMDAANVGIDLITFNSPSDFIADIDNLDKTANLYIDVNLSSDIDGVKLSKIAYERGFNNLYLITGSDPSEFSNLDWVKGVFGKTPPFVQD